MQTLPRRIRKNAGGERGSSTQIAKSESCSPLSFPSSFLFHYSLLYYSLLEIYRFAMLVILISLERSAPRRVGNVIFERLIKGKRCFLPLPFLRFEVYVCVRARACAPFIGREKLVNCRNWAPTRKHDLCLPPPLQLWKLQLFSKLFLHFVGKCAAWRFFFRFTSLLFFFFFFFLFSFSVFPLESFSRIIRQ
jgi:hypothetical protein